MRKKQTPSLNFYSRPCGRGDYDRQRAGDGQETISTHAPAGGATLTGCKMLLIFLISTHAPAGGATGVSRRRQQIAHRISTHAPAGGATLHACQGPGFLSYFYSRPCGRGDVAAISFPISCAVFLLTPLREGRRMDLIRPSTSDMYFSSRPCGRGDSNFPQVRHEVLRQIAER